ncbi:DUF7004 family protein [Apilactobacillus timberlakei]|uniref:DUF7004 family protein n=1 Tax=Apilactobacillus timberlakei TaxID=2008380 RepID=UPI00112951CA|nr:hypothetical protein [Apilactobacillus timberlakei]TPR22083.1 hypothetical protein DY083_05055 [Apilactobacillus timberlakei]
MTDFPKNKYGNPYDDNPYLNNEQSTVIKEIPNSGIKVGYEWGNKDPWVVFIDYKNNKKWPRDVAYFEYIKKLSNKYSKNKFMHDFLLVYTNTSKEIDEDILNKMIDTISSHYPSKDSKNVNYLLTVLYLAMVAEFHYVSKIGNPSIVNNTVKLIGIWQILFEDYSSYDASKWSYGKNPKKEILPKFNDVINELKDRGFNI